MKGKMLEILAVIGVLFFTFLLLIIPTFAQDDEWTKTTLDERELYRHATRAEVCVVYVGDGLTLYVFDVLSGRNQFALIEKNGRLDLDYGGRPDIFADRCVEAAKILPEEVRKKFYEHYGIK